MHVFRFFVAYSHQYVICAHEFRKLSYRISRELSVERDVRSNNGKEVVNDAFNEFNSIS